MRQPIYKQTGMSIIELMVALTAGLMVSGAVVAVMSTQLAGHSETIRSTMLNQELRSTMDIIVRELRRSGYYADAIQGLAGGIDNNQFAGLTFLDQDGDGLADCVLYAYDADKDGAIDDLGDWRGMRFSNGNVFLKIEGAAADADCNTGNWLQLNNDTNLTLTNLSFDISEMRTVSIGQDPGGSGERFVQLQHVTINMQGNLTSDANISRTLTEEIRVRNDLVFLVPPV